MFAEAEGIYRDLISRNPENCQYLQRLEESLHLDSEEAKLSHYKNLGSSYPRSRMMRKMPLLIATGKGLSPGIP